MSRSWPERVRDIVDAIDEIFEFTAGMTYEQFAADRKTQKAVLTNFMIIGEAAGHLPSEVTESYLTIPWPMMRGMRNIVVHVYFGINHETVWNTIQIDLLSVRKPLQLLLDSLPGDI